jgi:hypothetical protein
MDGIDTGWALWYAQGERGRSPASRPHLRPPLRRPLMFGRGYSSRAAPEGFDPTPLGGAPCLSARIHGSPGELQLSSVACPIETARWLLILSSQR